MLSGEISVILFLNRVGKLFWNIY